MRQISSNSLTSHTLKATDAFILIACVVLGDVSVNAADGTPADEPAQKSAETTKAGTFTQPRTLSELPALPLERFEKVNIALTICSVPKGCAARFITYLALEVVVWDWDCYAMRRNNYRVYHDPSADKIVFMPHGLDQLFHNPQGSILPAMKGLVARAVLETREGRRQMIPRLVKARALGSPFIPPRAILLT